jgi:hypothetical protein
MKFLVSSILRQTSILPHFKISEIGVHLTLDGVYKSMPKWYILRLIGKENLYIHNTSHGTVNTKITTKVIPKVFLRNSIG